MIAENLSGVIALVIVAYVLINSIIFIVFFVYSRFIFNYYLKKHHRQKWEELVYAEPHGLNWLSSDASPQMRKFRCDSKEDFGDIRLRKMRKVSIYLFRIGIWGWLSLLTIVIFISVAFFIFKK
jgi:hypothetical protein